MKKLMHVLVPLLLSVLLVISVGWYLFVYDRDFTRDLLLQQARNNDIAGNSGLSSWFYNLAYNYSGQDENVAIELANQYKSAGNYTKAEVTLSKAIAAGATKELYMALSKTYVEQDKLFARADVIALHCPLFPETQGIINKDSIAKMKDGVIIINNSRGGLIVEQDLADALNSGRVYAGLDVVSSEPIRPDNPLLAAKNCFITPHISWAPKEARSRIIKATAENLEAFLSGATMQDVYIRSSVLINGGER